MANGKRPISEEVRREVARRYGCEPGEKISAQCAYCDQAERLEWRLTYHRPGKGCIVTTFEFDHSIAESAGGTSEASNIVLACRTCNRSKGSKPFSEWRQ